MEISKLNSFNNMYFKSNEVQAKEPTLLDKDAQSDKVEISQNDNSQKGLTKAQKQEIIRKANTTAAGWSAVGSLFATLYFGLRSDLTVADKYGLDPREDKDFIKKIKTSQVLWTLPGAIPSANLLMGGAAWFFNKNRNPESINLDLLK